MSDTPAPASSAGPCLLVQNIAADCSAALPEFDPTLIISIVTALLGIFKNCMQPPSPAVARQHVLDGYHNNRYDNGTIRLAKHQAKIAARKAGTRLDDAEQTAVAVATLDRIRLSDDSSLQAALDMAA